MKFNYILFLILITSITTKAQFGFGPKAGGGVATLHTTYGENKFFRVTPSWHVGAFARYTLNDKFSLQSSLTYITKGYRDYVRSAVVKYNDYYRANYLEFTPQAFFTPHKFMVGIGPYISYGLKGRWKQKGLVEGIDDTNGKIIFVNDLENSGNDITVGVYGKKIDFGGTLSVGFKVNNQFSLLFNGSRSLINIAPTDHGFKPNYVDYNYNLNLGVQYHYGQ